MPAVMLLWCQIDTSEPCVAGGEEGGVVDSSVFRDRERVESTSRQMAGVLTRMHQYFAGRVGGRVPSERPTRLQLFPTTVRSLNCRYRI